VQRGYPTASESGADAAPGRSVAPAPLRATAVDADRTLDAVFSSIACAVLGAGRYSFSPDWRLAPGTSEHNRLLVAVRGAADVRVAGTWYRLAPGDVLLVPPHAVHEARNDPQSPLTAYVVDFEARLHGVLDVAAFCGLPVAMTPGPVRRTKIAASAESIVRHLTSLIPGYQLALHTHCVRLLDLLWKETLAQAVAAVPAGVPPGARGVDLVRFRPAFRLVEARYAEHLTLGQLADAVHLHPAYFSTLFKRVTGVSPLRFLVRYRVERARDLLLASDEPLGEIARRTGFYDAAHLIRVFRRVEGVAPGAYRRDRPERTAAGL
jgi:AraC family transcriptional regulator of arabinose operon